MDLVTKDLNLLEYGMVRIWPERSSGYNFNYRNMVATVSEPPGQGLAVYEPPSQAYQCLNHQVRP